MTEVKKIKPKVQVSSAAAGDSMSTDWPCVACFDGVLTAVCEPIKEGDIFVGFRRRFTCDGCESVLVGPEYKLESADVDGGMDDG